MKCGLFTRAGKTMKALIAGRQTLMEVMLLRSLQADANGRAAVCFTTAVHLQVRHLSLMKGSLPGCRNEKEVLPATAKCPRRSDVSVLMIGHVSTPSARRRTRHQVPTRLARIPVRTVDGTRVPDRDATRHVVTLRTLHPRRRGTRGEPLHDTQGRDGADESCLVQVISSF